MKPLTVRNVPEKVMTALRIRAARNGRSAEAEIRSILTEAVKADSSDFWARAAAERRRTPFIEIDSTDLIREMRDSR